MANKNDKKQVADKAKAGKYRFLKTLVGVGGAFQKGHVYTLTAELAEIYRGEVESADND